MESVFQQALAHHRAGRLEAAEPLYRQAAAWRPEWVLGNLGVLLRTTGRLEEAESVLREALAADPPNLAVRHTLGMTLLQTLRTQQRTERAIAPRGQHEDRHRPHLDVATQSEAIFEHAAQQRRQLLLEQRL